MISDGESQELPTVYQYYTEGGIKSGLTALKEGRCIIILHILQKIYKFIILRGRSFHDHLLRSQVLS